MAREHTSTPMELRMSVIGLKISNMVKVQKKNNLVEVGVVCAGRLSAGLGDDAANSEARGAGAA